MTVKVTRDYWVERHGKFWVIHVLGMDDAVGMTQARRWHGEIDRMARDYVAVSLNVPVKNVTVRRVPQPSTSKVKGTEKR